jgi:hypothetical protein
MTALSMTLINSRTFPASHNLQELSWYLSRSFYAFAIALVESVCIKPHQKRYILFLCLRGGMVIGKTLSL